MRTQKRDMCDENFLSHNRERRGKKREREEEERNRGRGEERERGREGEKIFSLSHTQEEGMSKEGERGKREKERGN